MTNPKDEAAVAKIATALTKAQRKLFRRWDRECGSYYLRADHDGRLAAWELRRLPKGLYTSRIGGSQHLVYALTPLGLAVRAHLQSETAR